MIVPFCELIGTKRHRSALGIAILNLARLFEAQRKVLKVAAWCWARIPLLVHKRRVQVKDDPKARVVNNHLDNLANNSFGTKVAPAFLFAGRLPAARIERDDDEAHLAWKFGNPDLTNVRGR